MPWSSNGTYLCTVGATREDRADGGAGGRVRPGSATWRAIYKPHQTERPLWDFPDGLYRREVAAYELSEALGWDLVPETILRDGPLGIGSLQRFVDADFEQHYFTLLEDPEHHPALKRMAVFDAIANNADRKGGHCLLDADGHVWGIDHGLCFHVSPKLRTVIWDWAGEDMDDDLVGPVTALVDGGLPDGLTRLLGADEADALVARAQRLIRSRRLPRPRGDHPYPWPLV